MPVSNDYENREPSNEGSTVKKFELFMDVEPINMVKCLVN